MASDKRRVQASALISSRTPTQASSTATSRCVCLLSEQVLAESWPAPVPRQRPDRASLARPLCRAQRYLAERHHLLFRGHGAPGGGHRTSQPRPAATAADEHAADHPRWAAHVLDNLTCCARHHKRVSGWYHTGCNRASCVSVACLGAKGQPSQASLQHRAAGVAAHTHTGCQGEVCKSGDWSEPQFVAPGCRSFMQGQLRCFSAIAELHCRRVVVFEGCAAGGGDSSGCQPLGWVLARPQRTQAASAALLLHRLHLHERSLCRPGAAWAGAGGTAHVAAARPAAGRAAACALLHCAALHTHTHTWRVLPMGLYDLRSLISISNP